MRRPIIYILAAIVIIGVLAVVWYLASPLFINRTVNEAFPIELPPVEELEQMLGEELAELEEDFMDSLPPEEEIAEMPKEEREVLLVHAAHGGGDHAAGPRTQGRSTRYHEAHRPPDPRQDVVGSRRPPESLEESSTAIRALGWWSTRPKPPTCPRTTSKGP